mgnify:CR=1 FL=1
MNYIKLIFKALKRLVSEELYISPENAVKRYRKKGVIIGENTELYNTKIDNLRPFLVEIGKNTLITGTRILTHDASTKKALGYTKVGRVKIGDNVFIGVNSIILPNIKIGNNVIIGAGTIVSKSIPDNSVVVGNPMKIIGTFEENIKKNIENIKISPIFKINYQISEEEKIKMRNELNEKVGFVVVEDEIRRLKNEV